MGEERSSCEHPREMRGRWKGYVPQPEPSKPSQMAIGWCCAACGKVEETGRVAGQVSWATVEEKVSGGKGRN